MDGYAESVRFLEIIFGGKNDKDYIVIWTKHGDIRRTFCFREIKATAVCGQQETEKGADVYVGVGPIYMDLTGQPRRGRKSEIVGLSCLWLDLDVESEGHKKLNLFHSIEQALELLYNIGLNPTLSVLSGGGLQTYFVSEQFHRITDDNDRGWLDRLSQGFQQHVRREAHLRMNCEIDMTGDITRVMRLPGTINQKYLHKPIVQIIDYQPNALLNFEDLTKYINLAPANLLRPPQNQSVPAPDITPINAVLPEACQLLMDLEPRFKAVMYREGGPLSGKESDSEYDLSIASQCVHADLGDSDIAAAIAWSRFNFGKAEDSHHPKWRRRDYIERTIRRARSDNGLPASAQYFAAKDTEIAEQSAVPKEVDRTRVLAEISGVLGIEITGIYEFGKDPPIWQWETTRGRITLGTPQQMMSWQRVTAQVFAQEKHHLRPLKQHEWLQLMDLMGQIVQPVEIGELASDRAWLEAKLREYVWSARTIEYELDAGVWTPAVTPKLLKAEGMEWIRVEDFSSWLWHQNPQLRQPEKHQWAVMLKALGSEPRMIAMRRETGSHSRQWFWSVPKQIMED